MARANHHKELRVHPPVFSTRQQPRHIWIADWTPLAVLVPVEHYERAPQHCFLKLVDEGIVQCVGSRNRALQCGKFLDQFDKVSSVC